MKKYLLGLVFCCTSTILHAQHKDLKAVNVDALAEETQISLMKGDQLGFIWWIPYEFWAAIMSQQEGAESSDKVFENLKKYTVIMVVDGSSESGLTYVYKSEEEIRKNLRIFDANNKSIDPIPESEIDFETKFILEMMKPIIKNIIGDLGENCQFLVFPNQEKDAKIVDPYSDKDFNLKYGSLNYTYDLPLASLLEEKKCSKDGVLWNPKYLYCPMHGIELK